MGEQKVKYDVDGYDAITNAVFELVNTYPALDEEDEITFSILPEDKGKTFYPSSGAIIQTEREGITGHVQQTCLYPFAVVFRSGSTSEERKIYVKEWLDNLGKWLEKQTVVIDSAQYTLEQYPKLTGNRKLTKIERQTPAFCSSINENKSEDWVINITAQYRNEFDR